MHITLRRCFFGKQSLCLYLVAVCAGISLIRTSCAQDISVDISGETLSQALDDFAGSYRVNLVYARRQVDGLRVTCNYRGTDLQAALMCILSGQNLRVIRLKRRQYVLVDTDRGESENSAEVRLGTLNGFVVDSLSKETLPGAHIYLPRLAIGGATNEAGYYAIPSLPLGQSYQARISFLGYTPLDTLLEIAGEPATIQLRRQTLEGKTVLVSSERRPPYEAAPGIRQIPVNRISKLPGFPGEADLLQSLRWLPSVQRVRTNQGGLVVRGGEPDQVQYLIDGAPIYHMWHIAGLLSVYQSEAFKDVRLYRGTFPAEHGGRLSAVLDAELKDGSMDQITGLVGVGLVSARAFVEGPITKKLSFMVSGRRSYLDRIIGHTHVVVDGGAQDTMRTGVYLYDISTKLAWRPSPRQRLSVGIYGSSDDLDIRLPVDLTALGSASSILPLGSWLRPANLFFEFDTRWSNRLISARYRYLHADRLFVSATSYATSYRAHERIFVRPTTSSSVNSEYGVSILDIGVKLDIDYYLSLANHIRTGISLVQRTFSSELDAFILQTNIISESIDEDSSLDNTEIILYAQNTWTPTPRLQIQPGVRVSQLRGRKDFRLSPRLGIQYDLNQASIWVATGVNVQYLHQVRDRYSVLYDLISYRWVPASRSVKPSYSYHASAGGSIFWGTSFTADIGLYLHRTHGLLLPRNEGQSGDRLLGPGIELGTILGQYTRGKAVAHGLEVNLQYERGSSLVWISYAAGRSRSRAPELGERQFRPGRFDVPQQFQIALQRTKTKWSYGVNGNWRSGYPVTVPEARYAVGDPLSEMPERFLYFPTINNGRLPAYINFGVQGGYQLNVGNVAVQVRLEVNNITFRRNVIGRVYDPTLPDEVFVTSRKGLPLYPLFEITARF